MAIVKGRNLNWKASPKDERDHAFKMRLTGPITVLPKSDLSSFVPMITDQGQTGSCTGFSFKNLYMIRQNQHNQFDAEPSALFHYYNARVIEGDADEDAGAYIRDIIKAAVKQGMCHEKNWPFNENKVTVKPSKAAYKQGLLHQITGYNRLYGADDVRMSLSFGLPVVYGVVLYDSFMTDTVATTGIVPMPDESTEEIQGGHAMCLCGHDDSKKMFLGINSWSEQWGHGAGKFKGGFYSIPYAYIDKYCDEAWNVTSGEQL